MPISLLVRTTTLTDSVPSSWPGYAIHSLLSGPSAVPIHDDGDVFRYFFRINGHIVLLSLIAIHSTFSESGGDNNKKMPFIISGWSYCSGNGRNEG